MSNQNKPLNSILTAHNNWRTAIDNPSPKGGSEVNLYSDAYITGQISSECGPYQFFNLVAYSAPHNEAHPKIVLRAWEHLEYKFPIKDIKTHNDGYHGGTPWDELAALLSLDMGIRLKPGSITRDFDSQNDQYGSPRPEYHNGIPRLNLNSSQPQLPYSKNGVLRAERIKTYPSLSPQESIVLIRAARSYQNALWIADSDPNTAWILLVSAIETAANHWAPPDDPLNALRENHTKLCDALNKIGGEEAEKIVANEFSGLTKSSKKFYDFINKFKPPEPQIRPKFPTYRTAIWQDPKNMNEALIKIYSYRSKALHTGLPFPYPMCEPPIPAEEKSLWSETPIGLGTHALGGYWDAKAVPIHLHVFEYITRNSLLAWWEEMAKTKTLLI